MQNRKTTLGITDETKQLLEEFRFMHREQIRLFRTADDGRMRVDDVIYYLLMRMKELEKAETIRKAKEQTAEILKQGEGEENAPNNNIQESKSNII
jgi:capsid protein